MDLLGMNDSELHVQFEKAAQAHQASTINILHFINECERRKSFLDRGYSSAFDYCVRRLKFSSSTAGRYIQAARCIRRNSEVLQILEQREVSVSSICQFASILDDSNKQSVLERVKGATRRTVELVARDYRPPVELRDRLVPVRVATRDGYENRVFTQFLAMDEYARVFDDVRRSLPASMAFGDVALMVFREYRDRHSPIARNERRKLKNGAASLDSHRWELSAGSRYIPDEVRDAVWARDGGRCTFVAADGTRCESRKGLEVDHIRPLANDGSNELSNLRLLCGPHNRRAAELAMGMHVMQPHWRRQ